MRLALLAEAEAELEDAAAWYDDRSERLGKEFLSANPAFLAAAISAPRLSPGFGHCRTVPRSRGERPRTKTRRPGGWAFPHRAAIRRFAALRNGWMTTTSNVALYGHGKTRCEQLHTIRVAPVNLRKTVDGARGGVYRIFEASPGVFHVLDEGGHTVDQFDAVETAGEHGNTTRAVRHGPRQPGSPDLAKSFVRELNAARLRH